MVKDWWQNLAERERRVLAIGGVVGGVLLLYALVWTPLDGAVNNSRDILQRQVDLLSYLQRSSMTIEQLRARGLKVVADDDQDVTTHAEVVFSSQGISAFIKQVQQPAANEVSFTMESVPFDKLMQALHALALSGVTVAKFSATRQQAAGLVDAKVTLVK